MREDSLVVRFRKAVESARTNGRIVMDALVFLDHGLSSWQTPLTVGELSMLIDMASTCCRDLVHTADQRCRLHATDPTTDTGWSRG